MRDQLILATVAGFLLCRAIYEARDGYYTHAAFLLLTCGVAVFLVVRGIV